MILDSAKPAWMTTPQPKVNPRVLVVEDDEFVASSLVLQLSNLGYEVVGQTAFGEAAIGLADTLRPDLVIMDIGLAGNMDGIAAASAIHTRFALPVVFLTSFSSDEILSRAKQVDFFGYLLKPVNAREMRIALEMALYKHQAEQKLRWSGKFIHSVLDSVTAEIAVLDAKGEIIAVNRAWVDFAESAYGTHGANGVAPLDKLGVGANYLAVCRMAAIAEGANENSSDILIHEGILSVINATAPSFSFEYPCHSADKKRWFHLSVTPLGNGADGVVVSHTDISERKEVEAQLRATVLEKNALLKEVHHRVKNNLQVITSLLRLQASRSTQTETKSVLSEMQSRIRTMAILHETLYRVGVFSSVDLGAFLKDLSILAFRAMHTQSDRVRLELDLASVQVSVEQATACGLLVNELISNCLKHGFPEDVSGEVRVTLNSCDDSQRLRLTVSDTGVGLPADFEARRGQSLGLQLVSDLAKKVGGELVITTTPAVAFEVIFSVNKSVNKSLSQTEV